MPQQQMLPTWLAWNNANFTSPTGITDLRTQQPFGAGGLGLGDYFDATEQEANSCSFMDNGLLHWGRYRLVQVDSGATAANVGTGMVGYVRIGSFVQSAAINAPGSGGTQGVYSYIVPPNTAGGSGAVLRISIGAAGTIVGVVVAQGGFGYSGPLSALTLPSTGVGGITGDVIALRLNSTPNLVTSADMASAQFGGLPPRAVVFLNSITPGNFGFVQELGLATLMASAAIPFPAVVNGAVSGMAVSGGTTVGPASIGMSIETAAANTLFKAYLQYLPVCQD